MSRVSILYIVREGAFVWACSCVVYQGVFSVCTVTWIRKLKALSFTDVPNIWASEQN